MSEPPAAAPSVEADAGPKARIPASTGRNWLPAGVALGHIGVIAGRIGAVIPGLGGVGLGVIIIPVVRVITPPRSYERATEEKSAIAKSIVVEPVIVKSIGAEPAAVKSGKSATMKAAAHIAKADAVKSTAPTTPVMRPGMGEIWLDQHATAYERGCGYQSLSYPGPDTTFA